LVSGLIKQFSIMAPMMQAMASGGGRDRAQMLQQMQQSMLGDPTMGGIKTKKSTGSRLSTKDKQRMQKERERQLRKLKRKK
ncbi:MAG: hypothetical protein KDA72_23350, partial [Planctomycetales bacterium]|nr:hypothetical protein [Planctomycetales bacterium]